MSDSPSFLPIPYGRQSISEADIAAVVKVLRDDYLTGGPRIAAFEEAFSAYVGSPYAVAVSSGTAALHLCALCLVEPGKKVITSPLTFVATANCVRYAGGEIVLADIDPRTGLLDPEAVAKLLQAAPAGTYQGIIPVDYAGYPAEMRRFRELANQHDLWLIEDACHAPGGAFTEGTSTHQCGDASLADMAIFSFHPVKHFAAGEGGMVTMRHKELYEKVKRLRTHGITRDPDLLREKPGGWYYEMQELGFNYRMTDIQAALGLSQLTNGPEWLTRRRALAQRYDEAFAGTNVSCILPPPSIQHAYHLYVVRIKDRKGLYDYLRSHQIYAQVHYIPVHFQPNYQELGFQKGDFPQAEAFYAHCLSLPLYPTLSDEAQAYVIKKVLEFVDG